MSIACCTCQCGSSEKLIRRFLESAKYKNWLNIPIVKGKARSKSLVASLPQCPEKQELELMLDKASKWAVIIGWTDRECRWADITHNVGKSRIDALFIVEFFG